MLGVLAVLTTRTRFDDPDMWWHLKTGQVIWSTGSIPNLYPFSYTAGNQPLVPQEWLSQVSIYISYLLGGYAGLMLWMVLFTVAILVAGYLYCSVYSGSAKAGFAGALVLWFFSTSGLAVRPQMIGYLLLIVELLFIHLGRTRSPGWFFALPPLFALWVNCHGSFFLGLIIGGVLLACSFCGFQAGLIVALRWPQRTRRMFGSALALSVPALWINPLGTAQVAYPLDTLFRQPVTLNAVAEWQPLQFPEARAIGLVAVLVGIVLLVAVCRTNLMLSELGLLAIGTWLAEDHRRLAFVFGILAAPIFARLTADALGRYDPAKDRPLLNGAVLAVCLLICVKAFPSRMELARQVEIQSPVQAVQYIKTQHLTGNMLNEFVFGGYLIWAAPHHPVFIDGRNDIYEWSGVLRQFARWATLQEDPNLLLNRYNIAFCLLARQSPMARVLPLLPGWKEVYADDVAVIFRRE
jgi:hypothetical protein